MRKTVDGWPYRPFGKPLRLLVPALTSGKLIARI